jgi:CelD/BcsL family acetyltransferase involved in cellulose biosynthesis
MVVVMHHEKPVAACFLAGRNMRRKRLVLSRALYLNTTGIAAYDALCVEHNKLLAIDSRVSLATIAALLPDTWDELFLPALDREAFLDLAAARLPDGLRVRIDREVADPYVDLARVREHGYLPLLGASTRAQIRRAQRRADDLVLEVARALRDAMDIYRELVSLHQHSWAIRGEPGAFADPWFDGFHRRLIAGRFAHGEILLTRLRAGCATVGCLYGLVSAERVLFYQSGLAVPADHHGKPGYLSHARTIEHCAERGLAIYDLLGGDARYKQNLATDCSRIVWGRVQRSRLRFFVEDLLRAWVRAAKRRAQIRSPLTVPAIPPAHEVGL